MYSILMPFASWQILPLIQGVCMRRIYFNVRTNSRHRSALVWLSALPLPDALSAFNFKPVILNDYMRFEPSSAWIFFAIYQGYYFILEPVAAVSCIRRRAIVILHVLLGHLPSTSSNLTLHCYILLSSAQWHSVRNRRSCRCMDYAIHWTR